MVYVEQLGGLIYNFLHLSYLNIYLDAPVGVFWRLGSLRFEKIGPTFHIQLINESFEILVVTKIAGFQERIMTALDKSNNQLTFLLSLLDIRRNLSTTMIRGHIQSNNTDILAGTLVEVVVGNRSVEEWMVLVLSGLGRRTAERLESTADYAKIIWRHYEKC